MRNRTIDTVTEESVLMISIFKWIILASIIGALVGMSTSFFLTLLDFSTKSISNIPYYYLCLPAILAITTFLTLKFAPDSAGHGTEKVIKSIHQHNGNMRLRIVPIKIITTILTITFGGSVGKEGPSAQIGAALAAAFSRLFKFNSQDRKMLVICGLSAGFSAVFGTPIAGAIFGVEVLFMGNLMYSVLLPSFIAGIVGFQVAQTFGIEHHTYFMTMPQIFDLKLFLITVGAGLFFGLVSVLFIELNTYIEQVLKSIKCSPILKALGGGLLIVCVAIFISTDYLGLGLANIDLMLSGESIIWYAFLLKIILTAVTLASGGSGGVITPLFFVGSAAGILFADILGVDKSIFAALGLVSVLGGAANTPLAACVLSIELFGSGIAPYATVACVVSFLMTGYRSIFPSQVLSSSKTQSIRFNQGQEIEHYKTQYNYKTRKIMASGRHIAKKIIKHSTHK